MQVESTRSLRLPLGLGLALACMPACGGGGGGGGGDGSSQFAVVDVSNGFGKLLPHQIAVRTPQGFPTNEVVEITSLDQLIDNATPDNPIRRPTAWPTSAILPNSRPGNHFLVARFSQRVEPSSVLSDDPSDAPGTIGEGIEVRTINPNNGVITPVRGRAFLGGKTFGPSVTGSSYELVTWVQATSGGGNLEAVVIGGETPGLGFPGTQLGSSFGGDAELVEETSFVFVADTDGDLTTHETFPAGQIQMRIGEQVLSTRGRHIEEIAVAASTVGPDTVAPEVQREQGTSRLMIQPGNAEVDVDPQTNIVVQFTEPIQAVTIGDLEDGTTPIVSPSIKLTFGPNAAKVQVPYSVRPISVMDLTRFELVPQYEFPGTGPTLPGVECGNIFGTVDIQVVAAQIDDLAGNSNGLDLSTFFSTREGPGIVNAPVTPDAIYIGRGGSVQGISVLDLNGFGQTTGDPRYDPQRPIKKGNSNYPNNPNVQLAGIQLIPPLAAGDCTFNGGSAGPMTLVRDTSLNDIIARAPQILSVTDMAIGHALDNTFNNEQAFGCQSGGGNICVQSGLKRIAVISSGPSTVASFTIAPNLAPVKGPSEGVENLASWAPHPNPPPLIFPPLCLSPLINGQEPTSIDTTFPLPPTTAQNVYGFPYPARTGPQIANLLVPGDFPFGDPSQNRPPQSALTKELNSFFEGPSLPQPNISLCSPYMIRQQIGQFLYVIDREASEVVVFNSNRFTVLDRIRLLDPTQFAMSPNLDFLAVTNEGADQVSFIDIDPASATFHQIIKTTPVGAGPTGIAWESGNEDIFVCNQGEGTVSIISGFTLDVRKTLRNQITTPIEVALTPRQATWGFLRGVYFGYILNQDGRVAFFESGPDGVNGIGFDDVIGTLPFRFASPRAMQVDPTNLNSAVWIVHETPLDPQGNPSPIGGGALSSVGIAGGSIGAIPLDSGPFGSPTVRQLEFGLFTSLGRDDGLSGIPADIAFDNMRNLSALTNFASAFSPGNPVSYNGKSLVKQLGGAGISATAPAYMFAAVPNPGVIDVFDMTSGTFKRVDADPFLEGTQSIVAPNANVLMDYFRQ